MTDGSPIDLIDGDELIDKLKDLQLGVIPITDYQIDDSWFASIDVYKRQVFFFMMMNAQNAGAGAGSNKMMNFGKSRARMSVGSENKITLKEVAGLKEEKEEPVSYTHLQRRDKRIYII